MYCGIVYFGCKVEGVCFNIECDMFIMDNKLILDIIFYNEILNDNILLEYEVKVFKVFEEQFFYLMSCGIFEEEVIEMIVMGFIELFIKEFLMEYVVEMNCLIKFEMEGLIG